MKTIDTLVNRTALIAVLILGSSAWLSAQTNQGQIGEPEGGPGQNNYAAALGTNSQSSEVLKINKGSTLIGATIKNQQGEKLGKIKDLVIDFNSGQVAYIVLDSETGLLSASKLHAVPLRAFQPNSEGTSLILNADKAKLDRSEGFAKDNWPAVTTAAWGAEPFWNDGPGTSNSREGRELDQRKIKKQQDPEYKDTTIEPRKSGPQPDPQTEPKS